MTLAAFSNATAPFFHMTARRKEPSGIMEIVDDAWQNKTLRLVMLVLIATGHPIGQRIIGLQTPAGEEVKTLNTRMTEQESATKAVAADLRDIRNSLTEMKADSESFHRTFTGFQVDFEKYRKPTIKLPADE